MPGGRARSFRLGDRAELLVQQLLTGVAFTTPVPRQEDIGVDFMCSLITSYDEEKKLLRAGPFFFVQAKSDLEPWVFDAPHKVDWISHQHNPILLCVADRDAQAMDVYSTWNLLCGVQGDSGSIQVTVIVMNEARRISSLPFSFCTLASSATSENARY